MKHMVKRILAGILAIVILSCPTFAMSFPDVEGYEDFASAVEYVSSAGLMVGDDKGNFNPYKTVTRAEMATILCRMLHETSNLSRTKKFSDLPENHWANPYIARVNELGIVGGYGDDRVGPDDSLKFEQAIAMIIRALGGDEMAIMDGGYPNGYISIAETHGMLESVMAELGEPLSRADVAIVLYNCANFSFVN